MRYPTVARQLIDNPLAAIRRKSWPKGKYAVHYGGFSYLFEPCFAGELMRTFSPTTNDVHADDWTWDLMGQA